MTTWMLRAAILLMTSSSAFAAERIEFYNGTRQMGMGGAVVASVNDETALLSNPAALGKLRNYFFTVLDPEGSGSTNNTKAMLSGGATDFLDPQLLLERLDDTPDKHFHALGQAFPSLVFTNFGIGAYGKYLTNAEVISETNEYDLYHIEDYALVLGFNFRIWDGRIKFGFNGKLINRVEVDETLPANSTGLQYKTLAKEGVGIGSDVGLILTAPWTWLPSVAGVLRDAGTTTFDLNDGYFYDAQVRPTPVKQSVDVGVSLSPILSNHIRLQLTGELRDVQTYADETDKMKRMHAGAELNFYDTFFFRGGLNQRYWTAGFEFSTGLIQLQAASYGEEIGTAEKTREDRRYMGKFALRF